MRREAVPSVMGDPLPASFALRTRTRSCNGDRFNMLPPDRENVR